ncbi:MAG: FHA domain-containing protein [Gemmatimonas sp.]
MTTAFAALLLGVAGAALLLALGAYWWVNRTPPAEERFDAYGRVPLFAVNLTASEPVAAERDVGPDSSEMESEPRPVVHRGRTAEDVMADRPSPIGSPVVIDTSALDAASSPDRAVVEPVNGTRSSFAPPVVSSPVPPPRIPPARVTPSAPFVEPTVRPIRTGWGSTPGWPVSADNNLSSTPRYVPPIRPDSGPSTPIAPTASNGNGVSADGVPGSMIEGHQLRFTAPVEGTLQFLPGRLEISTGLDTGREIRFVRVPGPNGTEVTFGRNEGPLYRHIQLRDQTVSREHARLVFAEGRWVLTNLSRTNPVAHNGRILRLAEEQPLIDGDRLEMGEVVFNFRSR